jgi:hypothetical protein
MVREVNFATSKNVIVKRTFTDTLGLGLLLLERQTI